MEIESDFWSKKKVLVTGHTGFKGSWLSLWLKQMGSDVIGISLDPPTRPSLYAQLNLSSHIVSLRCDIRNKDKLIKIYKNLSKVELLIRKAPGLYSVIGLRFFLNLKKIITS